MDWNQQWRRLGSRAMGSHFVFSLRYDQYQLAPEGKEREFVVIESRDWVNVIPLTEDNQVVLVRQFRHGVAAPSLEIPGGVIDDGESPLHAALRELREETGYAGEGGELLGYSWPNPALQNNRCHYALVRNVKRVGELLPDEFERLEVVLAPLTEIPQMIVRGEIRHSLVIAAFFLYQQRNQGG